MRVEGTGRGGCVGWKGLVDIRLGAQRWAQGVEGVGRHRTAREGAVSCGVAFGVGEICAVLSLSLSSTLSHTR